MNGGHRFVLKELGDNPARWAIETHTTKGHLVYIRLKHGTTEQDAVALVDMLRDHGVDVTDPD